MLPKINMALISQETIKSKYRNEVGKKYKCIRGLDMGLLKRASDVDHHLILSFAQLRKRGTGIIWRRSSYLSLTRTNLLDLVRLGGFINNTVSIICYYNCAYYSIHIQQCKNNPCYILSSPPAGYQSVARRACERRSEQVQE